MINSNIFENSLLENNWLVLPENTRLYEQRFHLKCINLQHTTDFLLKNFYCIISNSLLSSRSRLQ